MIREIIVTKDGSHSLLLKDMGETFHSKHGAVQESIHVYLKNGLERINKNTISILEFGFGTGLNALLTVDYAQRNKKFIKYETIEAYPLQEKEYQLLNYNKFVSTTVNLHTLHTITAGKEKQVNDFFIS